MNDINFQSLYYQLVERELRHLISITNLSEDDKTQVIEFLDHNELGLAFEYFENLPQNEIKPEATAQIEILKIFLSNPV